MTQLINLNQTQTMSSREIAELTGKEHKNVLVDIRNMLNELDLPMADFSAVYKADNGQEYGMFNLNKKLTLCLASGYSVPLRMKIIEKVETQDKPMTMSEIVLFNAQQLVAIERKQLEQEDKIKSIEHKLSQTDCSNNYYAITGFANLHGINVDDKTANKAGRKASKLCRERGIKIGDCGSTKFGKIGAYPEEILHEVFDMLDI